MLHDLWEKVRRFRTWVFNLVVGFAVFVPDVLNLLVGFDWSPIVPQRYLPFVGLAVSIVNIMMRPRPAVLKKDVEKAGA